MTKIEWTDETWNPVTGCSKVSPGCAHCFAERMAKRLAGRAGYPADDPFRLTLHEDRLEQPLGWTKPRRIFAGSMTDLLHEDLDDLSASYLAEIFAVMAIAWEHTFQVLTKRAYRLPFVLTQDFARRVEWYADIITGQHGWCWGGLTWPLPNLWLGVTAEDQKRADERIPDLLMTPAALRFVSVEPMLGPVDLFDVDGEISVRMQEIDERTLLWPADRTDWVIVGCETGPGRRPCRVEWIRDLVHRCQAVSIPVFVKALDLGSRVSKDPADWPEDLRVRQYPNCRQADHD